jgi:putative transposase
MTYRRFNGVQPGLTATRLLEKVVVDDTRADQHLAIAIDDVTLEPMGRPIVQFGICVRTRALLSVTPTLEDPGLFTAMGGLKRIVLPKVDLIAARPDLRDALAPHGKPGEVVWDRAWQQTGVSAQDALEDAHIDVTWADIEDPEFKAIGERVIGTFSRKLFHKAPGGIPYPPYILRKMGIDPLRTVVLTMSLFEERILDAWDDYQRQPHKGLDGMAPIEMWQRDSQIHGIEILPDPEFLDSAFGEVFDVSITREGVRVGGTRYHDPLKYHIAIRATCPVDCWSRPPSNKHKSPRESQTESGNSNRSACLEPSRSGVRATAGNRRLPLVGLESTAETPLQKLCGCRGSSLQHRRRQGSRPLAGDRNA